MEESSAAAIARGPHRRRSSYFDEQRASLRSSHSQSRPNSPLGTDNRDRNVSAADAGVVGTAHSSLTVTPLQAAAARRDAGSDADTRRMKHRRDASDTTQRSKHYRGTSDVTQISEHSKQSRHRSNIGDKSPRSKNSRQSHQTTPEKPPKTPKRSYVDEYALPAEYDNLNDAAAPSPVTNYDIDCGTTAKARVKWLTFYPGAPVIFSELWANVGGTLIMGFLAEDRNLFREEWGTPAFFPATKSRGGDEEMAKLLSEAKFAHGRVKKTIPLYIGLATGFCGSFTSFSSFIRDVFLALSNDLPAPFNHPYPSGATRPGHGTTVSRNGGYSFMAIIAVIATTVGLCLSAYTFGAHLALALEPVTPTLPFRFTRRFLDRAVVAIAWLAWLGAIFMTIWPPDRPGGPQASSSSSWVDETWRGQALFACVFAPLGCLLRFYASIKLNGLIPSFPLGTFAVNIFGTAVLGMAFDLQHVPLDNYSSKAASMVGGGRLGCQVLEGVMDGFCGCLTTVSTWIAELTSLGRLRHAYFYGLTSVVVGLALLVVVMGSVRWTIGFDAVACATTRWS
ncbi:Fluoride export protein 1 [Lasiodiplodia hormozganensis]|uniref:Fluoride export protein 1 n=1 Tax=Lasiodiplodia hormozganensis TaxID=869390 RepID=A0AA39XTQ5_9PEZI|nr:Fluoride export protein 1 [Lasiodiplodia hormozganensis]